MNRMYHLEDRSGNFLVGVERHDQLLRLLRWLDRRESPVVVSLDEDGTPSYIDPEEVN